MPNSQSILQKGDKRRWHIIDASDREIRQRSRESYLTFEALYDDTTVTFLANNANSPKTIFVSTDNGTTWESKTSTVEGAVLATIDAGERLLVKGTNNGYAASNAIYNRFSSDKDVWVYGNIASLTGGDNLAPALPARQRYAFARLFYGMTTLRTNPKKGVIVLPSGINHVTYPYAFDSLFYGCSNMTVAPEIFDTVLGTQTFYATFQGCSSLKGTFRLPFTTLGQYCCGNMFSGAGIESAELPFDGTLPTGAYRMIFYNATNFKRLVCLASDVSATQAILYFLSGVAPNGVFYKNPNVAASIFGNSIPASWTVEDYNL